MKHAKHDKELTHDDWFFGPVFLFAGIVMADTGGWFSIVMGIMLSIIGAFMLYIRIQIARGKIE